MGTFTIRNATPQDTGLIYGFILKMARYEKLESEVDTSEEALRRALFDERQAEVVIGEENGIPVGFALFFHNFSTFLGRGGIYLEDLYIQPEFRGRGYGKSTMEKLAHIAVERGCGRLEWWCLDRNQPSIEFYLSLGAVPMSEWTVYRISGDTLSELAEGASSGC